MKNKMTDLHNHLFAQMERLSEEGISAEEIQQEVKRADAMVKVSDQIIKNADLHLKAAKLVADGAGDYCEPGVLKLIQGENK